MDIKKLKELQRKSNELVIAELTKQGLERQFDTGTQNATRLRKALIATQKSELLGITLLNPKVHTTHSDRLFKSMFDRWLRIESKVNDEIDEFNKNNEFQVQKTPEHELADKFIRAFTLIHSVCVLENKTALEECKKLKQEFLSVIKETKGISVLAVIECEVISINKMRELKESNKEDEHRKLNGCEDLIKDIENQIQYLVSPHQSLFLIHLHGTLFAKKEIQFDTFRANLLKNIQWSKTSFQVEIKKLSKLWNEEYKGVETNLKHWARYITKGGNDWNNGKAYLRYKVGFNSSSEDDWITKNKRVNELLKQEHIEEGITDSLSMTVTEISELVMLIDGLMRLNRTRTGYLLNTR
jgi:hypothetical protein